MARPEPEGARCLALAHAQSRMHGPRCSNALVLPYPIHVTAAGAQPFLRLNTADIPCQFMVLSGVRGQEPYSAGPRP